MADNVRYTPEYGELYKRRKETVEGVFADAKEKHAMRDTPQYRGLAQITNWVKLKFAAMNLKKLAIWLWMEKLAPFVRILLRPIYARNPVYARRVDRVFRQAERSSPLDRRALLLLEPDQPPAFFRLAAR